MKPGVQIECCGQMVTIPQLSRQCGISEKMLRLRYRKGLRDEKLIAPAYSMPYEKTEGRMRQRAKIEYNGEMVTFYELSEQCGVSVQQLKIRYKRGLRGDDLALPKYSKQLDMGKHSPPPVRPRKKFKCCGRMVTYYDLAQETGLSQRLLRDRYARGLRDKELIKPVNQNYSVRYRVSFPASVPYTRQELFELWKGCNHRIRESQIQIMAGFMGLIDSDNEAEKLVSEFERMV